MSLIEERVTEYTNVLVKLHRYGKIEAEDSQSQTIWRNLLNYEVEVRQHFAILGLEVIIKQDEGYAFIKQYYSEDQSINKMTKRVKLPFDVSILLILLRQLLEKHEEDPLVTNPNKFITQSQLLEEVEHLLPQSKNVIKVKADMSKKHF